MKGCYKIRRFLDKIPKRVAVTILVTLIFAHAQLFRLLLPTAMKILSEKEYLSKENILYELKKLTNYTICARLEHEPSPPPYQDIRGQNNKWSTHDIDATTKAYDVAISVMAVPIGIMTDKYGGKHFLTAAVAAGIVSTFVAPFLIDATHGSVYLMKGLRVISAGTTSTVIVGGYSVMSHWAPPNERGRLCGAILIGTHIGATLHFLATSKLIRRTRNYALPFYIYSGTGLLLMVLWHFIGASTPHLKRTISTNEKLYLDTEMGNSVDHKRRKRIVLFRLFMSLDVLSNVLAIAIYVWSWGINLINMGVYMSNVLNRSTIADKPETPILFLLLVITGFISCFFTDWAINTHTVSRTTIRKIFTNIALMGPAIFQLAGAYSHCSVKVTGTMFIISGSLCGCIMGGALLVPYDLAPNYAGTIMALGVSAGYACLTFVDKIIEKTTPDRTLGQYRTLFWIVLSANAVCNYFFILFGNANEKAWNRSSSRVGRRRKSYAY